MAPNNPLTLHGNEKTMNLNSLILANIQSSPYFKVHLFELKTYHQVIDEIYYKVEHLEPWEKGSRKTAGQTGMCGGVRGVGAGGIVSSAFCLLYKLFTLKLTKKQVIGLLTHADSTYIRALGFMYIRYTQNPADLWDWYVDYLDDEEELDVKAGGGHMMSIGEILKQWLLKLEWYSTLFPRIPVPIQKQNEARLKAWEADQRANRAEPEPEPEPARGGGAGGGYRPENNAPDGFGEAERVSQLRGDSPGRGSSADRRTDSRPADGHRTDSRPSPPFNIAQEMDRDRDQHRSHERDAGRRDGKHRDRSRERERKDRDRHHKRRSRSRDRDHDRHRHKRSRSRDRKRSRSRDRRRSRSRDRKPRRSRERGHDRGHERGHRESSFDRDLRRERDRVKNGR